MIQEKKLKNPHKTEMKKLVKVLEIITRRDVRRVIINRIRVIEVGHLMRNLTLNVAIVDIPETTKLKQT